MGRPRLPLGTAGEIRRYAVKRVKDGRSEVSYEAVCKFRDLDGKVRPLRRVGSTKAKARVRLQEAIRDRARPNRGSGEITANTRLSVVGEIYLKKIEADVRAGSRSPGTYDAYEYTYNNHVKEELGELTVAEARVWVLDDHLEFIRDDVGIATAKLTRTVLSGMLQIAAKHDAIDRNPVKDCSRLEGGRRRKSTKSMYGDRRVKVPRWYMARLAVRNEMTSDRDGPIYPNPSTGEGLRDPANTRRDLRKARGSKDFAWVTSHNFRKTAAKAMKDAEVPEGEIADQLGQGDVRVTRHHYLPRDLVTSPRAAEALEGFAPRNAAG